MRRHGLLSGQTQAVSEGIPGPAVSHPWAGEAAGESALPSVTHPRGPHQRLSVTQSLSETCVG